MVSVLTLLGMLLSFQEEHDISVLVLRDGRHIATIGPYSIKGDWVHFTLENRAFVKCHLDKVNLSATDRENEKLQKILKDVKSKRELYDQVEAYKRSIKGGSGSGIFIPVDEDERTRPSLELGDVKKRFERMKYNIPEEERTAIAVVAILVLLSMLVSWGVEIYLVVKAFSQGFGWGLTILGGTLTYLASNAVIYYFTYKNPDSSLGCLTQITVAVFGLGLFITKLVFIIRYCRGYRLRIIFLWFFPFFFIIGLYLCAILFGLFSFDWLSL